MPEPVVRQLSTIELDLSSNAFGSDLSFLSGFLVLKVLVLDGNEVTSQTKFPKMPQLDTLSVNKNKIANLAVFVDHICVKLPNLTFLSMLNNAACPSYFNGGTLAQYSDYRLFVLSRLPRLLHLDDADITAAERARAHELYGGLTTATSTLKDKDLEKLTPVRSHLQVSQTPAAPVAALAKADDDSVEVNNRVVTKEKKKKTAKTKTSTVITSTLITTAAAAAAQPMTAPPPPEGPPPSLLLQGQQPPLPAGPPPKQQLPADTTTTLSASPSSPVISPPPPPPPPHAVQPPPPPPHLNDDSSDAWSDDSRRKSLIDPNNLFVKQNLGDDFTDDEDNDGNMNDDDDDDDDDDDGDNDKSK